MGAKPTKKISGFLSWIDFLPPPVVLLGKKTIYQEKKPHETDFAHVKEIHEQNPYVKSIKKYLKFRFFFNIYNFCKEVIMRNFAIKKKELW